MTTMAMQNAPEVPLAERLAYRKAEAAKLVGCSQRSLSRAEKRGELKVARVGGCWFVTREALVEWLNQFVR